MKKSISGNSGKERGELQRFLGNVSLSDLAKGINSKPEDFGLQVEGRDELEVRQRKSEDYRAKLVEYRLKITAHVILANNDGSSTKEIQRALNEHNIMLSYKNLDEMISRWMTAQAEGWPDDLRVCSKSPMLWSVSVVACTETDPGTSPRSADGASTESC